MLLAGLIIGQIAVGGAVLVREVGRQRAAVRARQAVGQSGHATRDALLAIGGAALLYVCLRGRAKVAKALGKGAVWLRPPASKEGRVCSAMGPAAGTDERRSMRRARGSVWRHGSYEASGEQEGAEAATTTSQRTTLDNPCSDNTISSADADRGKKK